MKPESLQAVRDRARARMIEIDLRGRGITDARVIEAFSSVPRHVFLPAVGPREAYGDFPVQIGHRQTVSQPYIVALMAELAGIRPGDRVLEIGTGCGYQTAILAALTPDVFTVEIIPELLERAKTSLETLGVGTVRFRLGDGSEGWEACAPFDAIVVSAAAKTVPAALESQLEEGGRLVIPVGVAGGTQQLMRFTRRGPALTAETVMPVRFVPLV